MAGGGELTALSGRFAPLWRYSIAAIHPCRSENVRSVSAMRGKAAALPMEASEACDRNGPI